jgi:hypothetical protein
MNLQVILRMGNPGVVRAAARRGALPDGRIWGILRKLAAAGLIMLADKAWHRAGEHMRTPVQGKEQAGIVEGRQPRLHGSGERANAQLKSRRILPKLRCCPWRQGNWPKRSTSFRPTRSEDESVQSQTMPPEMAVDLRQAPLRAGLRETGA